VHPEIEALSEDDGGRAGAKEGDVEGSWVESGETMVLNQCPNKQGYRSKRFWWDAIGGLMMYHLAD
jgi:hypothetical protein